MREAKAKEMSEAGEPAENERAEDEGAKMPETFCVVASNAIHEVMVDFCTCGTAALPSVQLLRARLYPATTTRPRSAATFDVLNHFHKMSFESKCSAYEFYNALARQTNNTGSFQPRVRTFTLARDFEQS